MGGKGEGRGMRSMTCRAYVADRSEVRGAKGWKHTIMRSMTRMEIGASSGKANSMTQFVPIKCKAGGFAPS